MRKKLADNIPLPKSFRHFRDGKERPDGCYVRQIRENGERTDELSSLRVIVYKCGRDRKESRLSFSCETIKVLWPVQD